HLRRGRAAVQYSLWQRRPDRRGRRTVDRRGLRGKHRTRAMAGWRPAAGGQHPHRARAGILRGTPRGRCRDGRRRAPGRLLDDDVGVRSGSTRGPLQIAASLRLRVIVRAGVCTDNIDLAAAASREIAVLNTPKASAVSVAELALGFLLALARRIPQADAALKSGRWPKKEFSDGIELEGKTLGIIGVGRIGGALGRCASALGMIVVGTDKELEPSGRFEGLELLPLEELLPRADFVSIHIPAREGGRAAVGWEEIARMKDGVLLVNCARGGVVHQDALLDALESGKVRGAALDVFAEEPPRDLRLARHPRVV